ncbi:MAG: ABC transporter ATP-binding protein [Deltaproteobacteria bacterium]|nr:ABC transporter ATP-binding protein [Deltaproteobacteria bacterium]
MGREVAPGAPPEPPVPAAPSCPSVPVLLAQAARIAVDGVVAYAELDLATRGDRVLCMGDTGPLLGALCGTSRVAPGRGDGPPGGLARVVAGSLRLLGRDVRRGEHYAASGLAPLDPPLPARWPVVDYLGWAARLAGASARASRALAHATLDRLGLADLGRRRLGVLGTPERRAAVIAQALVATPPLIVVEDPLCGLEGHAALWIQTVLGRAVAGRAALVSAGRVVLEGAAGELLRSATDLCVLRGGRLVAQAAPAELLPAAAMYELTVRRGAEALRQELAEAGMALTGGPLHFCLRLPEHASVTDALAAAARVRAVVISCSPLLG